MKNGLPDFYALPSSPRLGEIKQSGFYLDMSTLFVSTKVIEINNRGLISDLSIRSDTEPLPFALNFALQIDDVFVEQISFTFPATENYENTDGNYLRLSRHIPIIPRITISLNRQISFERSFILWLTIPSAISAYIIGECIYNQLEEIV